MQPNILNAFLCVVRLNLSILYFGSTQFSNKIYQHTLYDHLFYNMCVATNNMIINNFKNINKTNYFMTICDI